MTYDELMPNDAVAMRAAVEARNKVAEILRTYPQIHAYISGYGEVSFFINIDGEEYWGTLPQLVALLEEQP